MAYGDRKGEYRTKEGRIEQLKYFKTAHFQFGFEKSPRYELTS